MQEPVLGKVVHDPTKGPGDDFALKSAAKETEKEQSYKCDGENDSKRNPVFSGREVGVSKFDGHVPCHQGDGHEDNGDFGEEQCHPGKPFNAERFLDGNQIEVLNLG